jgi:NADH dehydrogenase [ubiquinone] 1 alpha subcomplex assembly factor 1
MASRRLAQYFQRSANVLRDNTSRIVRMTGADDLDTSPRNVYDFEQGPETMQEFITGCDADVGGQSTVNLKWDEELKALRFWGNMSLRVKDGMQGRVRGGYAGLRSTVSDGPSVIEPCWSI